MDSKFKNIIEGFLKSLEFKLRLPALVIISIQFEVKIFRGKDCNLNVSQKIANHLEFFLKKIE
jgi:hypothetical protein